MVDGLSSGQEACSPVIMQTAQIHLIQLVLSMFLTSRKKFLVAWADVMLAALASSRARMNWRDSGRQARTIAAETENPAPVRSHVRSKALEDKLPSHALRTDKVESSPADFHAWHGQIDAGGNEVPGGIALLHDTRADTSRSNGNVFKSGRSC